MAAEKNMRKSPRDIFGEYLIRHRKRRTAERFAILDCVMKSADHFTIDALSERLDADGFHVSLTTVYSTLDLLVDCNLVRRHRFGSDSARYERTVGDNSHHHLVCQRCGKVREVRDQSITDAINEVRYQGFIPAYFSLNIYGLCRACQKRDRRQAAAVTSSATKPSKKTSNKNNQSKTDK